MSNLIILWAPPRSRSTAFERMMIERKDFFVVHEPFCTFFDTGEFRINSPISGEEVLFRDIRNLTKWLVDISSSNPVFIKETCEYFYTPVISDSIFLQAAKHAFITRDLKDLIASHYRINPKVKADEIGMKHLFQIKTALKELGLESFEICSDSLVKAPSPTVEQFCDFMAIDFIPEALYWRPKEYDIWSRTMKWHKDVANSSGFSTKNKVYEKTIHNDSYQQELYDANLPFFNFFNTK